MTSADAAHALEHLQNSPLLQEGKVAVISVEAVRTGMGPRWAARRDLVYEHVIRTLRRNVGGQGFFLRISETDFLVAQPSVSRLTGQATCLNCLREILDHFLGEALVSHILVHEVSHIGDGMVEAHRLDVAAVEEAEIRERADRGGADGGLTAATDRWSPFVSADGRRFRASCSLEPVFQLKTLTRIGNRLVRRVLEVPGDTPLSRAEQQNLATTDIEKIDFATLARGLNRIALEAGASKQPSLILPVSHVTLASKRGRAVLADFFRQAQGSVQQGLICEVCDIEGVPPSALLAATSLIRPFCLFVVGRLAAAPIGPLSGLREAGLNGLSIECPVGLDTDAEFMAFASQVVRRARPVAKTLMFFRLASPRQAALAQVVGATHGSLAPAQPKIQYIDTP